MYDNEMYQLIFDIVNMLLIMVLALGFIFVWLQYFKYELKALNLDGYMDLRLSEKEFNTQKSINETNLKYELKSLKTKTKKRGIK